jgi:hypothetical protein
MLHVSEIVKEQSVLYFGIFQITEANTYPFKQQNTWEFTHFIELLLFLEQLC